MLRIEKSELAKEIGRVGKLIDLNPIPVAR